MAAASSEGSRSPLVDNNSLISPETPVTRADNAIYSRTSSISSSTREIWPELLVSKPGTPYESIKLSKFCMHN